MSVIAGLLRPDAGTASLDGRVLFDIGRPGKSHVWVPPHARGVALLAQEPLLFPHLSALDNVAFGARSLGQSRSKSRSLALHWLREVDAAQYAARKPAQLSGGRRSGSRLPEPSRPNHDSCSSTSLLRRWTSLSPPPSARCCAGCSMIAPR